jgi:hypothetical protein
MNAASGGLRRRVATTGIAVGAAWLIVAGLAPNADAGVETHAEQAALSTHEHQLKCPDGDAVFSIHADAVGETEGRTDPTTAVRSDVGNLNQRLRGVAAAMERTGEDHGRERFAHKAGGRTVVEVVVERAPRGGWVVTGLDACNSFLVEQGEASR